jgi:hypothetical protein
MPTFIDESGDPGPGEGSSRFFRLAAVWLEREEHVEQYLATMKEVRSDILKLPDTFEFHFAKNNHRQKAAFFDALSGIPFNFAFASIDKRAFAPGVLTTNRIRQAVVVGLMGHMEDWYQCAEACKDGEAGLNERVLYDECDDANYVKILKEGFRSLASRRGANEKLIRSIKPGKSKHDLRLQLADMVCGAVALYLDGVDLYYGGLKSQAIGIARIDSFEK